MEEAYRVGRVIARPFIGEPGSFVRTANRKDYAVKPTQATVLNYLKESGYDVIGLGKISDIYDGEGLTQSILTKDNDDGMEKIKQLVSENFEGIAFLNLVDFDALYGHRRNPEGYKQALERFDLQLKDFLPMLRKDDLLIITADHGNDPTHQGTDHTREYVPLLVFSPRYKRGDQLPLRESFADVGATIAENFQVKAPPYGKSFLSELNRNSW